MKDSIQASLKNFSCAFIRDSHVFAFKDTILIVSDLPFSSSVYTTAVQVVCKESLQILCRELFSLSIESAFNLYLEPSFRSSIKWPFKSSVKNNLTRL